MSNAMGFIGRIHEHAINSELLRANPLGDPHERPLWVYTPPGYDGSNRGYPVVYVIQGYTGQVGMWGNRMPWRQPYPAMVDAMFARGQAPETIVVYIDAWTKYGGSQYVDSPGTGKYHSYICEEIVAWVDEHYRTLADRDHRGIQGKSSGGYGAMITPMLRPDLFGALATHAGDAMVEGWAGSRFAKLARRLRDNYDSSWQRFLDDFFAGLPATTEDAVEMIMFYGCAAAYSADEDGTVHMPFDDTGTIVPDVWQRWLDRDPIRMAQRPGYAEALRSMRGIWIDAGNRDHAYLDLGATAFRRALATAGVPDDRVYYEIFEGTHAGIDHRYPLALAWLCDRLK